MYPRPSYLFMSARRFFVPSITAGSSATKKQCIDSENKINRRLDIVKIRFKIIPVLVSATDCGIKISINLQEPELPIVTKALWFTR